MPPQKELTGRRPKNYSEWHRYPTLPKDCYLVDADYFEVRLLNSQLIPVACFETIEVGALFIHNAQREYPLWSAKRSLYTFLKQRFGLPVFIVRHTSDCKLFSVAALTELGNETEAKVMNEDEYKSFLLNLGIRRPEW